MSDGLKFQFIDEDDARECDSDDGGLYVIVSGRNTFDLRAEIREHGGKWDGTNKTWTMTFATLEERDRVLKMLTEKSNALLETKKESLKESRRKAVETRRENELGKARRGDEFPMARDAERVRYTQLIESGRCRFATVTDDGQLLEIPKEGTVGGSCYCHLRPDFDEDAIEKHLDAFRKAYDHETEVLYSTKHRERELPYARQRIVNSHRDINEWNRKLEEVDRYVCHVCHYACCAEARFVNNDGGMDQYTRIQFHCPTHGDKWIDGWGPHLD